MFFVVVRDVSFVVSVAVTVGVRLDVKYMSENCDIVGRCHSFLWF